MSTINLRMPHKFGFQDGGIVPAPDSCDEVPILIKTESVLMIKITSQQMAKIKGILPIGSEIVTIDKSDGKMSQISSTSRVQVIYKLKGELFRTNLCHKTYGRQFI